LNAETGAGAATPLPGLQDGDLDAAVALADDALPGVRWPIQHVLEIVGGRPQCVMGTGALPLETPPDNIRLIRDYVLLD